MFVVPGLLGLVSIGVVMACTGGAASPARFYSFFVLVFGAYFLSAGARPSVFIAGCVAVPRLAARSTTPAASTWASCW